MTVILFQTLTLILHRLLFFDVIHFQHIFADIYCKAIINIVVKVAGYRP